MPSIAWLMLVAVIALVTVIVAVAAITGLKPKGTRPVAHTRLMGVARATLVVIIIIVVYFVYRSRFAI